MKVLGSVCIILFCCIMCSCRQQYIDEIKQMYSHPITLNLDNMEKLSKETSLTGSDTLRNFSLISYVDSSMCTSCTLNQLEKMNQKMYELNISNKVNIINILSPSQKDIKNIKLIYEDSEIKCDIFVDTCNYFKTNNSHIPDNNIFHTFLIDKKYNIRMIGNPLKSKQLESMLCRIINEK